jgi:Fe-S-cluster-containing dehydrogenase component
MKTCVTRRAFLKAGVGLAATAAVAMVPTAAEATESPDDHLATLIDITKCIGCGACVEACRVANAPKFPNPVKPFPRMIPGRVKVSDWSDRRDVADRLTPYNWLFIQEATVSVNGETHDFTFPRRCMHCVNPPCVKLCPWGAARQYRNGISRIDTGMCLGGSKCQAVCPWDIPQRQTGDGLYLKLLPSLAGNGIMNKCDRCYDRVAAGGLPACIEACPENVQSIGPRKEILSKAHELARELNGYLYGEHENGGTNTIYVSPVPFDRLQAAIDSGPGRPHLNPAADAMADAEMLGKAMLVAPFAGAAAAVGKLTAAVRRGQAPSHGHSGDGDG